MLYTMFCKGKKPLKLNEENRKENQMSILGQKVFKVLDQWLKHDIQIWGHKDGRHDSWKVWAQHPNFYLFCWLFCLGGHAFVLALLGLKV